MRKDKIYMFLTFAFFGFLFFHFAKNMLTVRPDGWYVGQVNLYGDLVFHLGFINKFLESGQVFAQNPVYPTDKPNYPIFADFVTSQVAKITGVDFALFITTFAMGILVIYVARLFIRIFIKNEKIVFLTLLLFFVNGGLGFHFLLSDFQSSQKTLFDFFISLPREYTDIKNQGYWWINTYLAYFLPQRGFLFAFPITLTVFALLYRGFVKNSLPFLILAGLLAGVLPLVQAHSLFVIFIISTFFFLATAASFRKDKRKIPGWFLFAVTTALVALPMFNSISSNTNFLSFVKIDFGWTSEENIVWFWLKNLGLFGPVLLISLFWLYKKNRHFFFLYLPAIVIFALSNIFVFQPWEFDNSKLLIYWFFASAIVVAYFLYDQFFTETLLKKILGTILVFLMIFSGGLDIFRTFTPATYYQIFTDEDLKVSKAAKSLTQKDSIFTTAPVHNHPIPALSGRSTLVGFHGWLWSHGIDYLERDSDVQRIYQGGEEAEGLIRKYKVNYVVYGPHERENFSINVSYFQKYPKIPLSSNWIVYDVSNLWADANRQN